MRRFSVWCSVMLALSVPASAATAASTTTTKPATSCASLTKSLVVADGYTKATGPVITPYNYKKTSANSANALGTTYDFGAKALVASCVSPSDLVQLSKMAGAKTTMSSTAYMAYMVKQSSGSMSKTMVAGVADYLDFGNGTQDGLGSLSGSIGLRLDAWVAGKYIILAFSAPAVQKAPASLVKFINATESLFG